MENALAAHPDIANSAVVGVDDAEYGQRLAAFVVPRYGSRLGQDELRKYLKRDMQLVTEIPRTPSGKIPRRELRI